MPTLRFTFDNVVNAAVLAVCVILGVSVSLQLRQYFQGQRSAGAINTYREGETLPALSDYRFSDSDSTIVLAVRSTCQYCTASMPFYKTLTAAVRQRNANIKIVAVSTDPEDVLRRYFESNGVEPPLLRSVPADYIHISGTPTILLSNASGIVQRVWIGLLDPEQEEAVLSAVTSVSKRSES